MLHRRDRCIALQSLPCATNRIASCRAGASLRSGERDMRKSVWLLSAGLFALVPVPAQAQRTPTPTRARRSRATSDRPSRPRSTRGTRRSSRAGRHRRHRHHRNAPQRRRCRTCRWRSARSPPRRSRNTGATRHPPAQPGRAVAARLLDLVRSRRGVGPYPRHRHGRRQPRPRKLGRRVHRRRLSLALGRRPDRARRDRPSRGAARAAGHLVRPQHLGRPDLDHHRQAALPRLEVNGQLDDRQLRSAPARARR